MDKIATLSRPRRWRRSPTRLRPVGHVRETASALGGAGEARHGGNGLRPCLKRGRGSSHTTVRSQGLFSARPGGRGHPAGDVAGDIPPPGRYHTRRICKRPEFSRSIRRDRRAAAVRACRPAVGARNATTTAITAVGSSGQSQFTIGEGSRHGGFAQGRAPRQIDGLFV